MDQRPRLLRTFLDLVALDSPSFEEKAVAEYVRERLSGVGATVTSDDSEARTGSNTGNLICSFPGNEDATRLLLAAHMDTVEPGRGIKARVDGDVITSDGETVLGADDKVGIAVTLEAIERIMEDGIDHGPIDLIYTVAEEKGLVGAKNLDWNLIPRADAAYVLDAEGLPGEVVIGAPYYESVSAVFYGRAAHSGVEPEAGVNALSAAATAITHVAVGKIDKETTANIGTIHGGRDRNIVPDRVEIRGEVRSLDEMKLQAQVEATVRALRSVEGDGVRVEVETNREFAGFRFGKDHPGVTLAIDGLMAAQITPHLRMAGGGSDANILNEHGLGAVVLSVGYNKAHALDERVHLSDMARSVDYLLEIVRIAGTGRAGEGS